MLALFSRFVRWVRLDGVRALKLPQLSNDEYMWLICGLEAQREKLVRLGTRPPYELEKLKERLVEGWTFRLQSANAAKSQAVETPEGSAKE